MARPTLQIGVWQALQHFTQSARVLKVRTQLGCSYQMKRAAKKPPVNSVTGGFFDIWPAYFETGAMLM